MALPADKVYFLPFKRLMHLVMRPTPGRLSRCVTLAIACSVGILIGQIWQLPFMLLIPVFLMAAWQDDRMMNIALSKITLIITLLLPSMLYVSILVTLNNDFMLFFAIITLSFLFFFLGSASKLNMLGPMIGLLISYSLINIPQIPYSDGITRVLLYITLIFVIVTCIMFFGGLLFSPSPKTILMQQIGRRLTVASRLLQQPDHESLQEELDDLIDEGSSIMLGKIALSAKEHQWKAEDLNALRQASLHSFALLVIVRTLSRSQDPQDRALLQTPELIAIINVIVEMAEHFHYNAYPVNIMIPFSLTERSHPLLQRLTQILTQFCDQSEEELPPPPQTPKGFFVPDAFTNIEHMRFSVKGAVCVLISLLIYKTLNWPGIHTCIITCFVVALPTMGEIIAKQRLRIGGALIGCVLAGLMIVFLIPHITNIAQLLLALGSIMILGGWIKCGDSRIAYGGLQIVVAFFLSDLTHFTPPTDLTVPRDRVIGILIGLSVTYIVFTRFWPKSGNENINAQFEKIKTLLRAENDAETPLLRLVFAAKTQETIAQTKHIIENAAREPPGYRPTGDQLQSYFENLEQASNLMGDLIISPDNPPDPLLSDSRFDLLPYAHLQNGGTQP